MSQWDPMPLQLHKYKHTFMFKYKIILILKKKQLGNWTEIIFSDRLISKSKQKTDYLPKLYIYMRTCDQYFLTKTVPLISPGTLPSSRRYTPKGLVYQILLPSLISPGLPASAPVSYGKYSNSPAAMSCRREGSQQPQTLYLTCSPHGNKPLNSQKSARTA